MLMSVAMVVIDRESVFDYVEDIKANDGDVLGYRVSMTIGYYSPRYNKCVFVKGGDVSDGATLAYDLDSFGWLFHDELCNTGEFHDGTKCTNLQASLILKDIMSVEKRWFRKYTWSIATFLFGGGKARDNGLF